jgi:CDP-6-deoxy-D-xylo-4-hexulose-3-dehydrase
MEIQGCIGNIQLKYLPEIISKRQRNFLVFAKAIYGQTDRYYSIRYDHIDTISNFAVPVICKTQKIRNELVKKCDGKVEIRPIVGGDITAQPFYKKYIKQNKFNCPNARLIHEQGLYFGNNPELTPNELQTIVRVFS